jgi:hypothetical protein
VKVGGRRSFGLVLLLTASGSVAAQDPVSVDQVAADRPAGSAVEAAQPGPRAGQSARGAPAMVPAPVAQLSSEGPAVRSSPQLTRAKPSAEGPQPLSSPAQGRTPTGGPIAGHDRCDPRSLANEGAAQHDFCSKILEQRVADFERTALPEPLPEERPMRFRSSARAGADPRFGAGGRPPPPSFRPSTEGMPMVPDIHPTLDRGRLAAETSEEISPSDARP